jgi:hypothetical protein
MDVYLVLKDVRTRVHTNRQSSMFTEGKMPKRIKKKSMPTSDCYKDT